MQMTDQVQDLSSIFTRSGNNSSLINRVPNIACTPPYIDRRDHEEQTNRQISREIDQEEENMEYSHSLTASEHPDILATCAPHELYILSDSEDIDNPQKSKNSKDLMPESHMDEIILDDSSDPIEEQIHGNVECVTPDFGRSNENLLPYLHEKANIMLNWTNIFAANVVCGSVRFTVQQYESMRRIISVFELETTDDNRPKNLPSYSKVRGVIVSHLKHNCFPKANLMECDLNTRRNLPGSTTQRRICEENPPRRNEENGLGAHQPSPQMSHYNLIMPSEWAKLDISMPYFYSVLSNELSGYNEIDHTSIVMERELFIQCTSFIFARKGPHHVRAGPGCIIKMRVMEMPAMVKDNAENVEYVFGCGDSTGKDRYAHAIEGVIDAVWCVGAIGMELPSFKACINSSEGIEREIISFLANSVGRSEDSPDLDDRVLPGDICALLRPSRKLVSDVENGNDCCRCVLISRFWREKPGEASQRLLWLLASQTTTIGEGLSRRIQILGSQVLFGDVHLVSNSNSIPRRLKENRVSRSSIGKLYGSNIRYVVYRALLYCDDFQPFSSLLPKGSVGGCYLLPLGIPPNWRTTRTAVHLLGLTPPGISTNQVLLSIIDDIVKMTTEGADGWDPDGNLVKIFIDIVGFIADYPAITHTLDVMGHNATAPCSLCTFRRQLMNNRTKYGYSTNIHAECTSDLRCWERHEALRSSGISAMGLQRLGMSSACKASTEISPLNELRKALEGSRHHIPRNEKGELVVSGIFDPYRSSYVAPDHLFSGLATSALHCCFLLLPNDQARRSVDLSICANLRDNGLVRQSQIYNISGKKLHSMTISGTYCVLSVAIYSFPAALSALSCIADDIFWNALQILRDLQYLIAKTFWWPLIHIDGETAFERVRGKNRESWQSYLQLKAMNYVNSVDKLKRKMFESGNGNTEAVNVMDKPNLHRLIELYKHAIPAFGHIRHFMELVFEAAHQPLKRCVQRSNHHNAHLSAVEHVLSNDWQFRLGVLQYLMRSPDDRKASQSKKGLLRLLLGTEIYQLSRENEEHARFLYEISAKLGRVFIEKLQNELLRDDKSICYMLDGKVSWVASHVVHDHNIERYYKHMGTLLPMSGLLSHVQRILDLHLPKRNNSTITRTNEASKLFLYRNARRVYKIDKIQSQKTGSHDVIFSGCVVQAMVCKKDLCADIISPISSSSTKHPWNCDLLMEVLYVVIAVVQRRIEGPLAVVVKCNFIQDKVCLNRPLSFDGLQLLMLGDGIRRVGIYHKCTRGCKLDICRGIVVHQKGLLEGGIFHFQRRSDGYPPRMG